MSFDERIEEMFLDLPETVFKSKDIVPLTKVGKLAFLSGQLPYGEGRLMFKGRVGLELTLDAGKSAARTAVVQALGVLKQELGSLNKIKKIHHIKLYIATGAEFKDHTKVLASATDLLKEVFAGAAKCSAEVAGCASLPESAAVELALVLELK